MKVYKIVKISDKGYISIYAEGKFRKHYKIGKETKANPKTLGLMVFRRIQDAVDFRFANNRSLGEQLIFKCDAKGVSKKPILSIGRIMLIPMLNFYKGNKTYFTTAPEGTYTCESLTPEKIVRDVK